MERLMKLTCTTVGCSNENIGIELLTEADQYMCGSCMQFITNAEIVEDAGTTPTE